MATENNNLDLFSLLPESLLLAILSFLPFKEAAARTCILNKKWLNIWQSGNNIDFDENFFVDSTSDEIKQAQRKVFIDFITNWIAHFNHRDIDKFSLKISNPLSCSNTIERCVAFAAQCRVKDLTLDFSDKKNFNNDNNNTVFPVPAQVYQLGSSLESLKLSSCGFDAPDSLNFNALKDLSLSRVDVKIKTLKTLLSTCRTIQSLSLEKCWGLGHFDLGYEPICLTRLVVNKCEMDSDYLSFNAPILHYFKYSGLVFTSDINAREIEEVDIDFALESSFNECGNELCKILIDFSAAKILTVCSYLLQVIPSGDEPVRIQGGLNVKHLILNTQMHPNELGGLEFLLNSCPLMEKLTMNIGSGVIFEDYKHPFDVDLKNFWKGRRVVPVCLIRSLKVVEMNKSKTTNSEVTTLYFLMCAGKVLEQINIHIWSADDGLKEIRYARARYLNTVEKCSNNLQISVY
ncbi:putative F-box/LRR-repeat protein At5g54820 [Vicia villosa]|uniref:putative F-box/LRR-repeat protein At5g54820 n=1 Tax=Vicia villosa TaxID=3911 RepID=UPI00273AF9A8|nr:putative F-box/LRR-repeat protein At5g54820 [Vicia villosa]